MPGAIRGQGCQVAVWGVTEIKGCYIDNRGIVVAAGVDPDNLAAKGGMDLSGTQKKVKAWKDIWSAGQGIGTVHKIEQVDDVVNELEKEYQEARLLP